MPETIRLGINCAGVAQRREVETVCNSFLVKPLHLGRDNCSTSPDEPPSPGGSADGDNPRKCTELCDLNADVCESACIGNGYDLHRLVAGRRLVLGGVHIPFDRGLDGHSDADAVCHAVTDAVLGACGAGDIGRHFPDTDPAWTS